MINNIQAVNVERKKSWFGEMEEKKRQGLAWVKHVEVAYPKLMVLSHVFRSIGNVVFCDNPICGALIMLGLLIEEPVFAMVGLLTTITAIAWIIGAMGLDMFCGYQMWNLSLFGFNAFLVGIAIPDYLGNDGTIENVLLLIATAVVLGPVSVWIKQLIESQTILPHLAWVFNITVLIWLPMVYSIKGIRATYAVTPDWPWEAIGTTEEPWDMSTYLEDLDGTVVIEGLLNGFSQVFLCSKPVAGVFILAAMGFHDLKIAGYGLLGSGCGLMTALFCGCDMTLIQEGAYGFNSVLVAIFVGYYSLLWNPYYLTNTMKRLFVLVLLSMFTIPLQLCLTRVFASFNLPYLSVPFCLIAWVYLFIERWVRIVTAKYKYAKYLQSLYVPPVVQPVVVSEEPVSITVNPVQQQQKPPSCPPPPPKPFEKKVEEKKMKQYGKNKVPGVPSLMRQISKSSSKGGDDSKYYVKI